MQDDQLSSEETNGIHITYSTLNLIELFDQRSDEDEIDSINCAIADIKNLLESEFAEGFDAIFNVDTITEYFCDDARDDNGKLYRSYEKKINAHIFVLVISNLKERGFFTCCHTKTEIQYEMAFDIGKRIPQLIAQFDNTTLRQIIDADVLQDVCLALSATENNIFQYVPVSMLTSELCLNCIKKDPSIFCSIPKDLITHEIVLASFDGESEFVHNYFNMPEQFITRDCLLDMVKRCGTLLQFIPKNILDMDFCVAAVTQNGLAIQFIAEINGDRQKINQDEMDKSDDIQRACDDIRRVRDDIEQKMASCTPAPVLSYVDILNVCNIALSNNGAALEFMQDIYKIKYLCQKAVKNKLCAIEFVPEHLKAEILYGLERR